MTNSCSVGTPTLGVDGLPIGIGFQPWHLRTSTDTPADIIPPTTPMTPLNGTFGDLFAKLCPDSRPKEHSIDATQKEAIDTTQEQSMDAMPVVADSDAASSDTAEPSGSGRNESNSEIVVELHNEKGKEIVVVFDNEGPLGLHITDTTDGQVHSPTPSALSVRWLTLNAQVVVTGSPEHQYELDPSSTAARLGLRKLDAVVMVNQHETKGMCADQVKQAVVSSGRPLRMVLCRSEAD